MKPDFPTRQTPDAQPASPGSWIDPLEEKRTEVARLLQSVIHYAYCAQLHLEAADDAVSLYDLRVARQYFIAAIRQFEPLRRSMSEPVAIEEASS